MPPSSPTDQDRKSFPAVMSPCKAIQRAGAAMAEVHEQAGAPVLGLGRDRGDSLAASDEFELEIHASIQP